MSRESSLRQPAKNGAIGVTDAFIRISSSENKDYPSRTVNLGITTCHRILPLEWGDTCHFCVEPRMSWCLTCHALLPCLIMEACEILQRWS